MRPEGELLQVVSRAAQERVRHALFHVPLLGHARIPIKEGHPRRLSTLDVPSLLSDHLTRTDLELGRLSRPIPIYTLTVGAPFNK